MWLSPDLRCRSLLTFHCMCTRQASRTLPWKQARPSQGDLRMHLLLWCVLALFLFKSSEEMAVPKTQPAIGQLHQTRKGQNLLRNSKRHSDGTFTSDFTHYLDKIKAKDFVEWLTSTKREG